MIITICSDHGVRDCPCGAPKVLASDSVEQAIRDGKPVDTIPGLSPRFGSAELNKGKPTAVFGTAKRKVASHG